MQSCGDQCAQQSCSTVLAWGFVQAWICLARAHSSQNGNPTRAAVLIDCAGAANTSRRLPETGLLGGGREARWLLGGPQTGQKLVSTAGGGLFGWVDWWACAGPCLGCLLGRVAGWLVLEGGWVVGCLLVVCLVALLPSWLPSCLGAWLLVPGCLVVWLSGCLVGCLVGFLVGYLVGCLVGSLFGCALGCLLGWTDRDRIETNRDWRRTDTETDRKP